MALKPIVLAPPYEQRFVKADPTLRVGDFAKIGFDAPEGMSEWLCVLITRIRGTWPNVRYCGELNNRPVLIHPRRLRVGSPVTFVPANILDILRGDE